MPKPIGNYIGIATGTTGTANVMDGVFNLFDQIRLRRTDTWVEISMNATGGSKIPNADSGNGYVYHVFESSGSLVVSGGGGNIEVLIVGGGGSGAGGQGGGGAGGGIVHGPSIPVTPGTYPVTIGAGGAAVPTNVQYSTDGNNGSPSSFNSVTALGGGGGLRNNYAWPSYGNSIPTNLAPNVANTGGGGGGSGPGGPARPASPQPVPGDYTAHGGFKGAPQGQVGGASGGGGAGAGENAGPNSRPSGTPSPGGDGVAFPGFPQAIISPAVPGFHRSNFIADVGSTGLYGGGGGGGDDTDGGNGGAGPGGGGAGGDPNSQNRVGAHMTGGGGGATGSNANPHPYAPRTAGGQGVVLIRYQV